MSKSLIKLQKNCQKHKQNGQNKKKGYKNMPKSLIKLQSHKQNWPKSKKNYPKMDEIAKSAESCQKCKKMCKN